MESRDRILVTFGNILREYRQLAGYTQEGLALRCNLDRTFISMLERGVKQPSMVTLFTLAETLMVTPSKILQSTEERLSDKNQSDD
ncbi:MAG: helix-turn-helix transcriptional regulator [Candidatus Scalindua sp.]|nr:helix-turn-helix transcriptional regulator [Candidatus Scalindua sp.]